MKIPLLGLLVNALLLFSATQAAALSFTETTDFAGALSPNNSFVGTLELGANQIFGTLGGSCIEFGQLDTIDCNLGAGDTQDSPIFTVAPGMQLESIEFSYENFVGPTGIIAAITLSQHIVDFSWNFLDRFTYEPTEGSLIYGDNLGLPAGLYGFSVYGLNALDTGDYFFDYAVTITVSAVPVPGALLLFSSGLLLLRQFLNSGGI